MPTLEHDVASVLRTTPTPPCLAPYQPTHRNHPEHQQGPIRYGNLLKELEVSLAQAYPARAVESLLKPFRALASDRDFWRHTHDGLAALGAEGVFHVFRLQRTVPELVVAADGLHPKPLIRVLQSTDRFQVLGVHRQDVRLFEGNREALDEIDPAEGVPRTITAALVDELTEPHLTVAAYGGRGPTGTTYHGRGGKAAEVDLDAERFVRAVDRAVHEHHSAVAGGDAAACPPAAPRGTMRAGPRRGRPPRSPAGSEPARPGAWPALDDDLRLGVELDPVPALAVQVAEE